MTSKYYMPARGEHAAPAFDQSKPRELVRFFEELEYLFTRADLKDEADKKKHVLRYVDFEVEQIWKTFPEYASATKSYEDFKAAILVHYPDASGDYVYSLRDMDTLIGECQRLGISNTSELADYHLKFLSITSWLIEKEELGSLEQQRGYVRAFKLRLLGAVNNRLQMKFPDHHPNVPYKVKDVYEAARFILQSATTAPQNYFSPTPPNVNPPFVPNGAVSLAKREPSVKKEDLGALLAEFTKTIVEAINHNHRSPSGNSPNNPPHKNCHFCGAEHWTRECDKVDKQICLGKCKRNTEGKVVLPSGAFVPRDIPGKLLSERIEEWHRRFPNQTAAATLLHTAEINHIEAARPLNSPLPRQSFQLSANDRIATIEAELFSLRSRNTAHQQLARTRAAQKAKDILDKGKENAEAPTPRAARQPSIEEVPDEDAVPVATTKETTPTPQTIEPQVEEPIHPYKKAKDAAYAPPTIRNIVAPVKAPVFPKRNDPAFKTLPPVHDPSIAIDVYKRSMEAPITITHRELLSLSPEVRSQVREVTTTRRIPNNHNPAVTSQNALHLDEETMDKLSEGLSTECLLHRKKIFYDCRNGRTPPRDAIIVPDDFERYYHSLPSGEDPDPNRLIVAKESSAVRSIYSVVDTSRRIECILDPGCQIIAMSEDVCHDLSLAYDPAIRLNMQSANGTTDLSLGLSRNVPFTLGEITLYMQVHVIRSPAYDILLGRPFDILTESVVKNFANEDQTITITDPNTGQCYTIPTFARGMGLSITISKPDFRL